MTADSLIKVAPILGGAILMLICAIAILRSPTISNAFAGLLVFAALLFVVPALSNFNFKGLGFEFQGATTAQVTEQAAGIKAELEDIKASIADLSKHVGAPVATASGASSTQPADYSRNRSSTVIVVYPANPKAKAIAKQMESLLLKQGYQATSIFSDYSELADADKGPSGSVRFVYTDDAKSVVASVKQILQPLTSSMSTLPDIQRQQVSGDVQVLLF
jgi:hypothetical protein